MTTRDGSGHNITCVSPCGREHGDIQAHAGQAPVPQLNRFTDGESWPLLLNMLMLFDLSILNRFTDGASWP